VNRELSFFKWWIGGSNGSYWQFLAGKDVQLFWAACSLGRRKNNEIGIDRL
jgi:hypothetical protein